MNDAERLLRGRHIVDLAGDFEKIDYAIERIHDLVSRSYYDLRKLAEHGRNETRLPKLRTEFDRNYLALRDITSGYLRLEFAHDRLYELMGDDKVRSAEARRTAFRQRREREAAAEAEQLSRRPGYRTGTDKRRRSSQSKRPAVVSAEEDDLDTTMMVGVSASNIEAAIAAAQATNAQKEQSTAAAASQAAAARQRTAASNLKKAMRQRSAELTRARPAMTDDAVSTADKKVLQPSGVGADWDMATMQVTGAAVAVALKKLELD